MKKNIGARLREGIDGQVFRQAELLVAKKGVVVCHERAGTNQNEIFFDIASLTKPLCVSLLTMIFVQEGKLSLEQNVAEFFSTSQLQGVTIKSLLNHTSGLTAWYPFANDLLAEHANDFVYNKNFVIDKILNSRLPLIPTPLPQPEERGKSSEPPAFSPLLRLGERVPGGRVRGVVYSDLGYILHGAILEKLTAKRLDEIYRDLITARLNIAEDIFFRLLTEKSAHALNQFVPSEVCPLRKKEMRGEVMDETAWLMGFVAGHAGLFARVHGIHRLLCELRNASQGEPSLFTKSAFSEFCRPDPKRDAKKPHFTLGFDTPTQGSSQSGTKFSKNSIGHLGFSGASFWWDLDNDFWIVLLTNRCLPDRKNNKIKTYRPALHDFIVSEFKLLT